GGLMSEPKGASASGLRSEEPATSDERRGKTPTAGARRRAGEQSFMSDFDLVRYQDPLTIQRVLHSARTIAIVGLSANELRASYFVGYYLKRHGYRVIPVNPRETEILGERCYPSLSDLPGPADVVNVFRAPGALPQIAR